MGFNILTAEVNSVPSFGVREGKRRWFFETSLPEVFSFFPEKKNKTINKNGIKVELISMGRTSYFH